MFAVAQTRAWFWRIVVPVRVSLSLCPFNKGMAAGKPLPPAGNARAPNSFFIHQEFTMNRIRIIVALSVAALATACASPGAPSGATASTGMPQMNMGSSGSMAAMDPRMKTMQEMHQKMMDAKTPADRQALMADHMKAMQGGMAMMKGMSGAGGMGAMGAMGSSGGASPMTGMGDGKGMPADMAKRQQMMADHMAMMQMMMAMMADRMPPATVTK